MQHKAIGGGTFEGQRVPDAKKLARVAEKFIYHSGTIDQLDKMKWGLEPQHGDWVREVASGTGLDEDELLDRSVPLVWMSENPDWVAAKVSRKLGKHITDVTREDIRNHGHLAMVPRKGDHAEHIWRVGDNGLDNGEYSPVTNLNGKTVKAYETDLYDYDEMGRREPFGVERNEYVSAQPVEPMFHLTGDDLLDFLDTVHDRSGRAQGGEVEDDDITAYHGTPHDFERFDLSKVGSGQGEQAYGHGLYFASNEDVAKTYRDDLSSHKQLLDDRPVEEVAHEGLMADEASPDQKIAGYVSQYGRMARRAVQANEPHLLDRYDELESGNRLRSAGRMYEVRIRAHPETILDWDKPLSEQPRIMAMLQEQHANLDPEHPKFQYLDQAHKNMMGEGSKGAHAHYYLRSTLGNKEASDYLNGMGIKGIKYLDSGSRGVGEGSHNYVIFDDSLVNVARKYRRGGEVEGYAEGGDVDIPEIENAISVFPKPQRMFPEDAPVPGGQYLNAATKENMTGHKAAMASIGVEPGGKPYFRASPDSVEETGSPGRGSATAKTNLFKQKAGWRWMQAPEGHENTNTIVSVEHRGQHHYALNAHFPKGVDFSRYENAPSEPRLRPTTKGNVTFGPQVGSISVRGKEHPVYEHVIVKNSGGAISTLRRMTDPAVSEAIRVITKFGSSPRDAVSLSKRLLGRQ